MLRAVQRHHVCLPGSERKAGSVHFVVYCCFLFARLCFFVVFLLFRPSYVFFFFFFFCLFGVLFVCSVLCLLVFRAFCLLDWAG